MGSPSRKEVSALLTLASLLMALVNRVQCTRRRPPGDFLRAKGTLWFLSRKQLQGKWVINECPPKFPTKFENLNTMRMRRLSRLRKYPILGF